MEDVGRREKRLVGGPLVQVQLERFSSIPIQRSSIPCIYPIPKEEMGGGADDHGNMHIRGGHFLQEDIAHFNAPFFKFSSELAAVRSYDHTSFPSKR